MMYYVLPLLLSFGLRISDLAVKEVTVLRTVLRLTCTSTRQPELPEVLKQALPMGGTGHSESHSSGLPVTRLFV